MPWDSADSIGFHAFPSPLYHHLHHLSSLNTHGFHGFPLPGWTLASVSLRHHEDGHMASWNMMNMIKNHEISGWLYDGIGLYRLQLGTLWHLGIGTALRCFEMVQTHVLRCSGNFDLYLVSDGFQFLDAHWSNFVADGLQWLSDEISQRNLFSLFGLCTSKVVDFLKFQCSKLCLLKPW